MTLAVVHTSPKLSVSEYIGAWCIQSNRSCGAIMGTWRAELFPWNGTLKTSSTLCKISFPVLYRSLNGQGVLLVCPSAFFNRLKLFHCNTSRIRPRHHKRRLRFSLKSSPLLVWKTQGQKKSKEAPLLHVLPATAAKLQLLERSLAWHEIWTSPEAKARKTFSLHIQKIVVHLISIYISWWGVEVWMSPRASSSLGKLKTAGTAAPGKECDLQAARSQVWKNESEWSGFWDS